MTPQAKLNTLLSVALIEERKVIMFSIGMALVESKDPATELFGMGEYVRLSPRDKTEIQFWIGKHRQVSMSIFSSNLLTLTPNGREVLYIQPQIYGEAMMEALGRHTGTFKTVLSISKRVLTIVRSEGDDDDNRD
jgi:hypothetical protein